MGARLDRTLRRHPEQRRSPHRPLRTSGRRGEAPQRSRTVSPASRLATAEPRPSRVASPRGARPGRDAKPISPLLPHVGIDPQRMDRRPERVVPRHLCLPAICFVIRNDVLIDVYATSGEVSRPEARGWVAPNLAHQVAHAPAGPWSGTSRAAEDRAQVRGPARARPGTGTGRLRRAGGPGSRKSVFRPRRWS